ncbi:FYVE and coiled-coil domain-containing protein [Hepatocystis sp. ex Piliocolobus tephrosceles]|nr:FYVE and coiled-coil domain-containing protein [Hepatocystis sp. ex Piliocolobus tephrosceles]
MGQFKERDFHSSKSLSHTGDTETNENDKKCFWVPDDNVTNCHSCNVFFNVRVRKHHCRACGNVFCSNCSDNKIKISEYSYSEKVRVCDKCFVERSAPQTLLLQEDLGARKQINQDLKKALSEKMAIVERFKTFLIEFDNEIIKSGDSLEETGDIVSLLNKSEQRLKDLNKKIKNYDSVIEKQKKELEKLKIEKEKKTELNKMLNQRNYEIQQKNMNIKNLIKDKNELTLLKEESESIINSYKKQVEKLIIRCNQLELEKKNVKENKGLKNNSKYSLSTNNFSSFSHSSFKSNPNEISMAYAISNDYGDEQEEEGNCCRCCRQGLCAIM